MVNQVGLPLWAHNLSMTRNLTLFFALVLVMTTEMFIWTTWVGNNQLRYNETPDAKTE